MQVAVSLVQRGSGMKHLLALLMWACSLSTLAASAPDTGDWRDITPEEEQFVQLVESRVYANLRNAAQRMGSKWKISNLKTNEFQRAAIDGANHRNRPHEVRIEFFMDYVPADDAELGELDREVDLFAQKISGLEDVPAAVMRTNPGFKRQLYAQIIVNYGGFMPLSLKAAAGLGQVTDIAGTEFSYQAWKGVGVDAPKHTLLMGEFRRGMYRGDERLLEAFTKTPDCRNVRTIIVAVTSAESVSDQFIKALDIADLNALVANH